MCFLLYRFTETFVLTDIFRQLIAMTPVNCVRRCQSKGFKYAGVEWGNECYCGNHVSCNDVIIQY